MTTDLAARPQADGTGGPRRGSSAGGSSRGGSSPRRPSPALRRFFRDRSSVDRVSISRSSPHRSSPHRLSLRRLPWTGPGTPDRLRRTGAVVVLGCLLVAVLSIASGVDRTAAVRDSGTRIASLIDDSAALYQALADADATATSGYVSGGREATAVRDRYDADVRVAAARLVHAAGLLPAGDPAGAPIAAVTSQLPVYTGLIETARTYNRQGLPLGQSYLNSASGLMRSTILPAAEDLRARQTAALAAAHEQGSAFPVAVVLFGVALIVAIAHLAVRERARTNRVLSPGLVAATVAIVAALMWWAAAAGVSGGALGDATRHADAATALDDARAAVLQARSNESLVLVARGAGSADQAFATQFEQVIGPDGRGGLLAAAAAGGAAVDDVRSAALEWQDAHRRLRELDGGGRYEEAVESAVGTGAGSSGAAFGRFADALDGAVLAQRAAFAGDVARAGAAQTLLRGGPAVLLLLAGAAVGAGVVRRVAEYR